MRGLFSSLFLFAVAIGACQLVAGIDDRTVADVPTEDSGPIDSGGVDAITSCRHAYLPEAGTSSDGVDVPSAVYSLNLSFAAEDDAGFDLDGVCSDRDATTSSCAPVCDAGVADDLEGRDNAAGTILANINAITASLGAVPHDTNHRFRLLIRLSNYNGTDEDPSVRVGRRYRSHGIAPVSLDAAVTPTKDGQDVWTVTADSLVGTDVARATVGGFVTQGRLAARLDSLVVPYGAPGFFSANSAGHIEIALARVALVLPMPHSSVSARGGVIVGAWSATEIMRAVSTLREPDGGPFLCGDAGYFPYLKGIVCANADLSLGASPCEALS